MSGIVGLSAPGPLGRDARLAAVTAVMPLAVVLADDRGLGPDRRILWGVLALAECAALVVRRQYPLSAAATCGLASVPERPRQLPRTPPAGPPTPPDSANFRRTGHAVFASDRVRHGLLTQLA